MLPNARSIKRIFICRVRCSHWDWFARKRRISSEHLSSLYGHREWRTYMGHPDVRGTCIVNKYNKNWINSRNGKWKWEKEKVNRTLTEWQWHTVVTRRLGCSGCWRCCRKLDYAFTIVLSLSMKYDLFEHEASAHWVVSQISEAKTNKLSKERKKCHICPEIEVCDCRRTVDTGHTHSGQWTVDTCQNSI